LQEEIKRLIYNLSATTLKEEGELVDNNGKATVNSHKKGTT
jgi:hypothetical protein